MTRKQIILIALITGILALGVLGGLIVDYTRPTCTEDMACWNCETMGNLVCGIGIDAPWEDYLPYPLDELAYWFVDTFVKE